MFKRLLLGGCLGLASLSLPATAVASPEVASYVKRLHQQVVGVPILSRDARFVRMRRLVEAGQQRRAVEMMLNQNAFYASTIKSMVAPWSTMDGTDPTAGFDDLQAMVMGAVRDGLDARLLLTGDFTYRGQGGLGLPPVAVDNNNHYLSFELGYHDYYRDLVRIEDQWPEIPVAAGVLSSRSWAAAHMDAGTNRRPLQYTFQLFLCSPIEQWRDLSVSDQFVRRDVTRSPGDEPATYQNLCRGCHAPMDSMAGAYAHFDFVDGAISYRNDGSIAPKYNQNPDNYSNGYVTTTSRWVNLARFNQNQGFGWRGPMQGVGLESLGEMIAESEAYSRCWVRRVAEKICDDPQPLLDPQVLDDRRQQFEDDDYNLRELFISTALDNRCISP